MGVDYRFFIIVSIFTTIFYRIVDSLWRIGMVLIGLYWYGQQWWPSVSFYIILVIGNKVACETSTRSRKPRISQEIKKAKPYWRLFHTYPFFHRHAAKIFTGITWGRQLAGSNSRWTFYFVGDVFSNCYQKSSHRHQAINDADYCCNYPLWSILDG